MSDSDIVAASALCILSLLNYRNVLIRKNSDITLASSLCTGTSSASEHLSNAQSSVNLVGSAAVSKRTKSVKKSKKAPGRPKPVRHLSKSGKKRSSKIATKKTKKSIKKETGSKVRRKRRCWMKAMRTTTSMEKIFKELTFEDSGEFSNFFKMSRSDFDLLLTKIEPAISKQTSRMRLPIPAKIRLAIVLHYLATGASYRSIYNTFKVSVSTITTIIREVCEAICNALENEIKLPETPQEWLAIEEGFRRKFPRCVGALDRKHIISATHFNPVGASSMVLTSVIDSDYCFVSAEVCSQDCQLFQKLEENSLNLPPESPFPGRKKAVPYVFIGDETLTLHKHVMVPFLGNHVGTIEGTFNYTLTNTREMVENVFGVLTDVFRIFRKPIDIEREKIPLITMTCVLLHNFLRRSDTSRNIYSPLGTFDACMNGVFVGGSWRQNIEAGAIKSVPKVSTMLPTTALKIRCEFAEYFGTI